jgi:hypothetical protein
MESMHAFDSLVANCLCVDPNHPIYQTCRSYTTAGLEIGSLAIGSYGLAKGGVALAKMGWRSLSAGAKAAGKVASQELKYLASQEVATVTKKTGRNRMVPDANAVGTHTVFRRNSMTGKVAHYETYRFQTNSYNPSKWESVVRFDNSGKINQSHFNKILKKEIHEPHIHDPLFPGGVRYPEAWEIPN